MKSYDEIKREIDARSIEDWNFVLGNLQKCADSKHTVVHLPYSTSWIFTTGHDCRWCIDPAPFNISDEQALVSIGNALADFDFCILSHAHGDHYYKRFVRTMAQSQTLRWVLPDFLAQKVIEECDLNPARVVVLHEYDVFEHKGIVIKSFPGLHAAQIPSASFFATMPDGLRLAFPVDVRDYCVDIPAEMEHADWLFSHLWLGRKVSHLQSFPLLDDFCRFNLKFRPHGILVGHLNETSRAEDSMWTYRHWNLVKSRMKELAPEITVRCPVNGSAHLLLKDCQPDYFEQWSTHARQDFERYLGIALHKDIAPEMDAIIRDGIKVLELRCNVFQHMERKSLLDCIRRWRDAGGECLSLHLPELSLDESDPEMLRNVIEFGFDRVTLHVPKYPLEFVRANWEKVLDLFKENVRPLTEQGVVVGIENMHTKPGRPIDQQRRFGLTIPEWLEFVNCLRERCGERIGCHLDLGHAYTNLPFHQANTLETWMQAGASLINGLHIHQYETDRSEENPFPDGHRLISGRTAGFPLLAPLFRNWQRGTFHCPIIIEMRDRYKAFSYVSRKRLLDAWPNE